MGIWLRRAALLILLGVATLAVLTANVLVRGEAAMEQSDQAFNQGELREAVLHARRAAVLYAPGAPHVNAAYDRLAAVAVGAETAGRSDVAQTAWRAMRAAALETRHWAIGRQGALERANRNLARLAARASSGDERGDSAAAKLETLGRDETPRALWVLVLALGFTLAGAGVALIAVRGISPEGRLSPRVAAWSLLLTAAGAACWTLAVLRA